ncbi:hypothetical protein NPX13_g5667 [Xylaria arbuscula]|uniref:Uncharacterized protein n=1 Tax=Xylaria arbuscula TaxID=114810 RepID=A0A9W8TMH7_9PEZI|nr:hypothetical protein NPX13_g5667 [Xylaria arbuscula]
MTPAGKVDYKEIASIYGRTSGKTEDTKRALMSSSQLAGSFLTVVREASQQAVSHAIPWHHIITATGANKDKTRLYPNHPLLDIMVTFHDERVTANSKCMRTKGLEPLVTHAKGAKFLLLVEFSALTDNLILLRMEFDNGCIPERDIIRVQRLVIEATNAIVDGRGYSEMKRMLRSILSQPETGHTEGKASCALFGKRLDSLLDMEWLEVPQYRY